MCGRYAIFAPPHRLKDLFGTETILNGPARYNAAPLQDLPIIIKNRMGMARWGLLPPWAQADDRSLCAKMINARSETVSEKPAFAESWQKRRRCLIPASGFYEWKTDDTTGTNQPYFITDPAQDVLALAGLWAKKDNLVTFTILTKDADGDVAGLHHRMPVIMPHDRAAEWFAADTDGAKDIMARATGAPLSYHAVSTAVGKVSNDDAMLVTRSSSSG